jgi:hypothetical protein
LERRGKMKEMTDERREALRFIAATIEALYQQRPGNRYELADDKCELSAVKSCLSGKWRIRPRYWSEEKRQWFDFGGVEFSWLAGSFTEGMERFRAELEAYNE